jgi:hypothetical protein
MQCGMRNHLQKRFEKFLETVKDANIQSKSLLSLDVPTKWNSIYLMLKAAEKCERAFDRMVINDKKLKGPPRSLDWKMLGCFASFLDFFMKQLYVSLDH